MRIRTAVVALCLLTGLLAPQASGTPQDDRAAIEAFYGTWMGAIAKGPTAYASYYASDGQILPPNAAPVTGRDAIADWLAHSQSESQYVTKPEGVNVDEIRFLGPAWVVHRSTLRGQRLPKAGGDPVPFETKYFDLLHRHESGRWEVVYRMWSDNRAQIGPTPVVGYDVRLRGGPHWMPRLAYIMKPSPPLKPISLNARQPFPETWLQPWPTDKAVWGLWWTTPP
jgi:uncharacterized protein (TIGR02246 family)